MQKISRRIIRRKYGKVRVAKGHAVQGLLCTFVRQPSGWTFSGYVPHSSKVGWR